MGRALLPISMIACTILTCGSADVPPPARLRIAWQRDYESALREAQFLNRELLVYFTSDWSPACSRLDHAVLGDPRLSQLISEHAVAVRINAATDPEQTRRLRVESLPCVVVVSKSGFERGRIEGFKAPAEFHATLEKLLNVVPTPSTPAAHTHAANSTPASVLARAASIEPASHLEIAQNPLRPTLRINTSLTAALAGFCPVTALEGGFLVPGNPVTQRSYDGRKYWFADADAAKHFDANPGRFIPALDGNCPVSFVKDRLLIPGDLDQLVVHRDRLYLLAGLVQYETFCQDADRFTDPDLALRGACPVCRVDRRANVPGIPSFRVVHEGRLYHFDSADHRRVFHLNPTPYVD